MPFPHLIADDLTGALEAGATFRLRGWTVAVQLRGVTSLASGSAPGLRIFSTESRNLPPPEAAAALRALLGDLGSDAGVPLFKKIDSTLRGAVGAELAVLLAAFPRHRVLLSPANPLTGRTVSGGVLRVDGCPVHTTAFARDPGSPVLAESIAALLEMQGIPAAEIGHGTAGEARICICDAVTAADVRAVVDRARREPGRWLLVGSSALGSALADALPPPSDRLPVEVVPPLRDVFLLCGSRHPASAAQLEALDRARGWAVVDIDVDAPAENAVRRLARARGESRRVAARLRLPPQAGTHLIPAWIRHVLPVLDATRPLEGLFLTGGETAAAAAEALGVSRFDIAAEIEPGIVASRLRRPAGGSPLIAVTKPGAYGSVSVWIALADRLLK